MCGSPATLTYDDQRPRSRVTAWHMRSSTLTGRGDRILYGLPREGSAETDVWVVPADGTGSPAVYIPYAWSPSVVR